ncbi:phage terminase large subunit GpA-like protein [Sporomusaceae bacterium BoRhaA]|uniref:phage terminase large subunit family protein n=1 Tax=Pelorhabdus rhamnosifermentans TaxID=2772457 RepID=UPI001C060F9A|nr:terminase gpA endonuclease subunit [Pelorhabdus rhamnosifermentans]MBU2701677.1 phage terminase large subunit GpA-like protein [Pelorhabdus rhamnosifermentans]
MQRKSEFPLYITKAFSSFKPPEKLTVSQWADKYRILSEKDSAAPGPWRTDRTPYLKEPMNAFNDEAVQDITFVAGTQLGKTVMELNMIGYAVAQDPGPMLIVYPSDKLAKFTSENRLQPMFELSSDLRDKFQARQSQWCELQFPNMYIALVGANSPSNLASRPVRYIFFDEIDKFPKWSGAEAGPLELAEERTKTFYNKKKVKVSSPTLKRGNIWQGWENANAKYKYFVPCPHCGEFQTLEFKQIKGFTGKTPQEAKYSAYYECKSCHQRIDDRHKMPMLRAGEWRRVKKVNKEWVEVKTAKGRVHSVAYHLNSIYSPWLTFGDVAEKFLSSKDDPEKLMNFINSWLAEPWEDKASKMQSDVVLEKQGEYEQGRVHHKAQLLTMGVDVQLDHFWWSVRAWGAGLTSWLVDYGRAETWADIETILDRNYCDESGEINNVNLCCMDSGYNTDEVYQFCAKRMDVCLPTKGASKAMTSRYSVSIIDKGVGRGLRLYIFDPNQFKDFIAGRLSIVAGDKGSWNVYKAIDRRYCDQICAEQKVEHKDKKGRVTYEWEKISSHAQNHLLDTETNNALAAEILGVRYLTDESEIEEIPSAAPKEDKPENDWFKGTENWL